MTAAQLDEARRLICAMHRHIRATLLASRARHARRFAEVARETAADTIYHVDDLGEAAIGEWFSAHWPRSWPVEIVMEGLADGESMTFPHGVAPARTAWKCIIDPIDGTRGLMHDKRSAWVLTGLAPQRGPRTTLADIEVAVMTELPTTKQWRADQVSAVRGRGRKGVVAQGTDVRGGGTQRLALRPSQAEEFAHGFASFARFFPAGKALTAQLEEAVWAELVGRESPGSPLVFEDQYISTGGQLYELLAGHDRMIGDLRPLVFAKLGLAASLACHPYDLCTELILREAGGVVEAPDGRPVRAPLDLTTPVAWMGYANEALACRVRPVLRRVIRQLL